NCRFTPVLPVVRGGLPGIASPRGLEPGQFCLEVDPGRTRELILVGRDAVSFPATPPLPDEAPTALRPTTVRRSKTGRPHYLDRTSRSEVFNLLEDGRSMELGAAPERRSSRAQALRAAAAEPGLADGLDLGLGAGITDLLQ